MRNGEALPKLGSADCSFGQFVEHGVGVVVKSLNLRAGQEQSGICGTAEIELGRAAIVCAMEIANRECRPGTLAGTEHGLRSQKYFGDTVCALPGHTVVDYRLAGGQELQSAMNGKFHHFVECEARRKLRRMACGAHARLKLQIPRRCKRRRSGNRRTS